jgi:hypothetical protein
MAAGTTASAIVDFIVFAAQNRSVPKESGCDRHLSTYRRDGSRTLEIADQRRQVYRIFTAGDRIDALREPDT